MVEPGGYGDSTVECGIGMGVRARALSPLFRQFDLNLDLDSSSRVLILAFALVLQLVKI